MTLDAAIDRIRVEGPSGQKTLELDAVFAERTPTFLATAEGGAAVGGASNKWVKAGAANATTRPLVDKLNEAWLSIADFGAVADDNGTSGTDNLAAWAALLAESDRTGIKNLLIPPGAYYTSDSWLLGIRHGITIIAHGATVRTDVAVGPAFATLDLTDDNIHFATDPAVTWYALDTGTTIARGGNYVQLSSGDKTAGLAAIAVGDVVTIRSNAVLSSDPTHTPIAEYNVVASADANGFFLLWKLSKDYLTATLTLDATYPPEIAKARAYVRDFRLYGLIGKCLKDRAVQLTQVVNGVAEDIVCIGSSGFYARGTKLELSRIRADVTPDYSAPTWNPYLFGIDVGTSRVRATGLDLSSSGAGTIHVHEDCADIYLQGRVNNGASDASNPALGVLQVLHGFANVTADLEVNNSPGDANTFQFSGSARTATVPTTDGKLRGRFSGAIHSGRVLQAFSGIAIDNSGWAAESSVTRSTAEINGQIPFLRQYPPLTDAAGSISRSLLSTNDVLGFQCADGSDIRLSGQLLVPEGAALMQLIAHVTKISGTSAGVSIWFGIKPIADAGGLAGSGSGDYVAAWTPPSTALLLKQLTLSSFQVTPGKLMNLMVGRKSSDAGDTFTGVVGILALEVRWHR